MVSLSGEPELNRTTVVLLTSKKGGSYTSSAGKREAAIQCNKQNKLFDVCQRERVKGEDSR